MDMLSDCTMRMRATANLNIDIWIQSLRILPGVRVSSLHPLPDVTESEFKEILPDEIKTNGTRGTHATPGPS
eukprot:gene14007-572_t